MLRSTLLITTFALTLGACNLYFDDPASTREPDPETTVRYDDPDASSPFDCESDSDCGPGCYCSEDTGCEEAGFCNVNTDCLEGFVCDERQSCVPHIDEPAFITCQGPIACEAPKPICPEGTTAVLQDGCYSGTCMAKEDCPDGAPFECSDLNSDEVGCTSNTICEPVYKGVDCTSSTGAQCTDGATDCVCESFAYDYCGAI